MSKPPAITLRDALNRVDLDVDISGKLHISNDMIIDTHIEPLERLHLHSKKHMRKLVDLEYNKFMDTGTVSSSILPILLILAKKSLKGGK